MVSRTGQLPGGGLPVGKDAGEQLVRFDRTERVAHWLTALCVVALIVTGAALYVPALVGLIGRRALVVRIHVDVGLAMVLPVLVSLAGSWGKGLRADIRRLNRWSSADRQWLHLALSREPTGWVRVGKFNAGQKLSAAFFAGAMVVMLMTGSIMHWPYYWPLAWRTGATFVHDLVAYCLVAVVVGHVAMALGHPRSLRSMLTGRVGRAWAERHSPLWLEELDAATGSQAARAARAGASSGRSSRADHPG